LSEYLRQFFHLFFGSIVILLLLFFGQSTALTISIIIFVFGLALSHSIKQGLRIEIVAQILKKVQHQQELDFPGFGAISLFFGIILVLVFSNNFLVTLGAISILTFGDAFSNLIGTAFGKIKIGKRYTLEGTIGGIAASFVILAMFLTPFVALTSSTIAMLSEFLEFEDNISIPVTGAIVLSILL